MAFDRVSVAPHGPLPAPGKGNVRPLYEFGRVQRWTVSAVALVLHSSSFLYLTCFAVVYSNAPDDQIDVLQLYAPGTTSVLVLAVAILNLYGIVCIFCPRCADTAIVVFDPSRTPTSWLGRVRHQYIRCFSRYGLFGLHGDFYDVRRAAKHVVQIATLTREAHTMSLYLTRPGMTASGTMILAAGCVVVPWMLFSRHPFVHRWGSSFVDAILSFVLCAGFPLVILFYAILDFYVSGSDALLWNRAWIIEVLMLARAVSVKSLFDLLSMLFLFTTSFMSVKTLHAAVHVNQRDGTNSREASASLAALAVGSLAPHRDNVLWYCRRGLLVLSTGMSVFLVATAAMAISREECPVGCVMQTYPWFSQSCHCVLMRHNCILNPVPDNDIDTFIQASLTHVFELELVQCHLPHGLSKATLASLYNLYSLTLRLTDTVAWDLSPLDFPRSMYVLYLIDQRMPRLPNILSGNSNSLRYLLLRNVSLTTDNTVPDFANLFQVALSNLSLTNVPPFVVRTTTLTSLEMDHNLLTDIPLDLTAMPSLHTISLMSNAIRTVPLELVRDFPATLKCLHLDGNPIESLPPSMDVQLLHSKRVRIQGTPLCARLQSVSAATRSDLTPLEQEIATHWDAFCAYDCALGCRDEYVTDTVCEIACLTPACHFDSTPAKFDAGGVAASECFGFVTGWEHWVEINQRANATSR